MRGAIVMGGKKGEKLPRSVRETKGVAKKGRKFRRKKKGAWRKEVKDILLKKGKGKGQCSMAAWKKDHKKGK